MQLQARSTRLVKALGGRASYCSTTGKIAYDFFESNGYFDIYIMNVDGTGNTQLTVDHAGLPNKHHGTPRLSPDGAWMLFQAERVGAASDVASHPGIGTENDLYIMKIADGTVTNLRSTADQLLWAQWHPGMGFIMWSEKASGVWTIKVAEITLGAPPALGTITSYAPGSAQGFYEAYGWMPPGNTVISLAGLLDVADNDLGDLDIALFNPATTVTTKITNTDDVLDEHGYPSPFGDRRVVFISSRGQSNFLHTDLWLTDGEAKNPQRLTHFNDPGHDQYIAGGITIGPTEWLTANTLLVQVIGSVVYPRLSNLYEFTITQRGRSRFI